MQTEESRALVTQAWAAFASREAQRIASFFEDDAEWIAPQANGTAVAFGGEAGFKGAETIAVSLPKRCGACSSTSKSISAASMLMVRSSLSKSA